MREILFRGKNEFGTWHYGAAMQWNGRAQIIKHHHMVNSIWQIKSFRVIPETVGQFTGITDKNGVKIFEGDCFEYDEGVIVIEYSNELSKFSANLYSGNVLVDENLVEVVDLIEEYRIGNIIDNPELLK